VGTPGKRARGSKQEEQSSLLGAAGYGEEDVLAAVYSVDISGTGVTDWSTHIVKIIDYLSLRRRRISREPLKNKFLYETLNERSSKTGKYNQD